LGDRARTASLMLILALVVSACTPQGEATSSGVGATEVPRARKVVTIADSFEPQYIIWNYAAEGRGGTADNIRHIVHDDLILDIHHENFRPQLAAEVPSFENKTWVLNSDGTMETTWRLRPNVKWHDGQPFTSADLMFSFQTSRDKDIAGASVTAADRLIDSASAPDPLTFVVRWNGPYVEANRFSGVAQIGPRHLLEDMYRTDKQSLQTTPLFTTEFVGLGPYRLVNWDRGSSLQVERFDDYYLGRPHLDTIHVRFVPDPNTLLANILAGAVDVVISSSAQGLGLDQAAEARRRWEGTANQVVVLTGTGVISLQPQHHPARERPMDTGSNLLVRTALHQAIDRATLADVMSAGTSPVPDSYFLPTDPRMPELDRFIVKFQYDPRRAMELLQQAGWNRGSDGVWVRQRDGQRFEIELWQRAGTAEKAGSIITDDWKRLGIDAQLKVNPQVARNDRSFEPSRPGYLCCPQPSISSMYSGNFHQRAIPRPETNWTGDNYSSYVNPETDALIDQLAMTLNPRERLPIEQRLIQLYAADVYQTHLWWQNFIQLVVAGVKGPDPAHRKPTTNILEWDRT
jgi:peptide/nickel transport system substrate-binding protein